MPFDITDAKERIETLEESLQEVIAILARHFPEDMGRSEQMPENQDVGNLLNAFKKAYPDKFAQVASQPEQQTPPSNPVIYQGYEAQ